MNHHHGGVVSMKPRVPVTIAFRENVVRSDGNGPAIKKMLSYLAEKAQYKQEKRYNERMENQDKKEI